MSEIAERALELLPRHQKWQKGSWGVRGRACLGTALIKAAGMDIDFAGRLSVVDAIDVGYACIAKVPAGVLAKTQAIILEQFPERMAHMVGDDVPVQYLITAFNDDDATTFADVRLVLEKLAAG